MCIQGFASATGLGSTERDTSTRSRRLVAVIEHRSATRSASRPLADVRKRYPKVRLSRHPGGSELSLYRQTGEESGASLVYGFNASGRLVRLQTGVGGC